MSNVFNVIVTYYRLASYVDLFVSQYGQLKGSLELDTSWLQKEYRRVAEQRILGGGFAKEFTALDEPTTNGSALNGHGVNGMTGSGSGLKKRLDELYSAANDTELAKGEQRVRQRLGLDC